MDQAPTNDTSDTSPNETPANETPADAAPTPDDVRLDEDAKRFVLDLEGQSQAFIDFRRSDDGTVALTHVEVPRHLEGNGYGTTLMKGALAIARERGFEVLPQCPFAHSYIRRHQDELDLVSDRYSRLADLQR